MEFLSAWLHRPIGRLPPSEASSLAGCQELPLSGGLFIGEAIGARAVSGDAGGDTPGGASGSRESSHLSRWVLQSAGPTATAGLLGRGAAPNPAVSREEPLVRRIAAVSFFPRAAGR
jgi:hypothetical protein